jgi:hypothetical protein
MNLNELLRARNGLPDERQAARKIATFAVIPAAMCGLLMGARFVGIADPAERLVWVCVGAASASGLSVAFLVLGIHYLFGFRPIAILADALVGLLWGLVFGGALFMSLLALHVVRPSVALCALLLIPLGSVTVPVVRAWRDRSRK